MMRPMGLSARRITRTLRTLVLAVGVLAASGCQRAEEESYAVPAPPPGDERALQALVDESNGRPPPRPGQWKPPMKPFKLRPPDVK